MFKVTFHQKMSRTCESGGSFLHTAQVHHSLLGDIDKKKGKKKRKKMVLFEMTSH